MSEGPSVEKRRQQGSDRTTLAAALQAALEVGHVLEVVRGDSTDQPWRGSSGARFTLSPVKLMTPACGIV